MKKVIYEFSQECGIDSQVFEKSVEAYSSKNPEDIPYIQEITKSVEFETATSPMGKSQLEHNMELTNELPKVIPKIKVKYD